MFAALVIERDLWSWADVPRGLFTWIRVSGGFAALGLVLWLLVGLPKIRREDRERIPRWQVSLFFTFVVLAIISYVALAFMASLIKPRIGSDASRFDPTMIAGTVGGGFALAAVFLPFVLNMTRMSFRRIYALAKLSFKEAIRRRVLYAFSGLLLVFLFGSWFVSSAPADQVRTYVGIVSFAMTLLLLFTAGLIASFSIPADIRQQTIHTIVTKPVERFEVVLGRFLGYLALMTVVLLVMTAVSLLYVLRGVNPEAATESLKARVPLYGELKFENTESEKAATNVGREWEYRSYITGIRDADTVAGGEKPGQPTLRADKRRSKKQTALWNFKEIPSTLNRDGTVRCEYSFDIYRTTKGDESRRDISCTFLFTTWRFNPDRIGEYNEAKKTRDADYLAEEFGIYEIPAQQIVDYHTQSFDVPGGLFRNALASDPDWAKTLKDQRQDLPPLQLRVTSNDFNQYVGMARYDFYVRLDQPGRSEQLLFALNFFKSSFGLWMRLALVIGVAVSLSTYLSGVISLLVAFLLYIGGVCREFIVSVAQGQNVGGGPMESIRRISQRQLAGPSTSDSASTADRLVSVSDDSFRWVIDRILYLIPDIERFDLTNYVAEGFNIPGTQMGIAFLYLLSYLLMTGVLAFYLMQWREVANPN